MVYEALDAAKELAKEGISAEVIDPRTLVPMDHDTIIASVKKTGRLLVVDEACQTAGAAAEIVSFVTADKDAFRALKAAPVRVCAPDVPIPFSPPMEKWVIPDKNRIMAAVKDAMLSNKP
jgi:pyruvate dehydrogenase E1 component beta subunit